MANHSRLRDLRVTAGLSVRELARQIGQNPTNVSYWERSGQIPRSDVLAPMARALGVPVEQLLGDDAPQSRRPAGRLQQVFESAARLPRRQQDKVVEFLENYLRGVDNKAA